MRSSACRSEAERLSSFKMIRSVATKAVSIGAAAAVTSGCATLDQPSVAQLDPSQVSREILSSEDPERVGRRIVSKRLTIKEIIQQRFDNTSTGEIGYCFPESVADRTPMYALCPPELTGLRMPGPQLPIEDSSTYVQDEAEHDSSSSSRKSNRRVPRVDPLVRSSEIGVELKIPFDNLVEIPGNTGTALANWNERWQQHYLIPGRAALIGLIVLDFPGAYTAAMQIGNSIGTVDQPEVGQSAAHQTAEQIETDE